MNTQKQKPSIKQISIETQEVLRRLIDANVGEVIPYSELSRLAMGDIQTSKRFALTTAVKRLRREHHRSFACVTGVGVKRLEDVEIVHLMAKQNERIGRVAKLGLEHGENVDYENLDPAERQRHCLQSSLLAAIKYASQPRQQKKLEARLQTDPMRLAVSETIRLLVE